MIMQKQRLTWLRWWWWLWLWLCRRDSFITHRAFCDALAEENNKVNQGLINNIQNQMPPQLTSSIPNTSISMSDFNTFDPKNPLKSLPQDLVPMPFKSMNIGGGGGGMFSTTSGALFGGARTNISSSSSSLQLSSNTTTTSSAFNYLQDAKISGAAHMSATALLQKAAQMGATASNSTINSPMMQKSYANNPTTTMTTPPDPIKPLYDQSHMIGGGFIQKTTSQDVSQLFDQSGGGMNDLGVFTSMYMSGGGGGGDQGSGSGPSRFGDGDMMTLDLLGIGGGQQRLDMEAMNQQRIAIMKHLSCGDSVEKQIWDV